ncbi:MAG TPA: 1-(5-phosphoribosyl)-5-[(5-phosphoribosylamino)methylideneamino]imidazole-4-carboxamide isomerase [Clostridia bacterium]|nr:1-(5-phosphoribosyl)-5-[(5-phosphoribosylamino)methylideneamino]imidazole-4-carboxamide isomerase [Clostridia bacterium]
MKIIPAIDIKNNRCVRLYKGQMEKETIYFENPLDAAINFQNNGFSRLHIVDLDGAVKGSLENVNVLKTIKKNTEFIIQYGGGIRNYEKAKKILDLGIDYIIIGTMAIKAPKVLEKISNDYPGQIIVSLDVNNENVAISGWKEDSKVSVFKAIEDLMVMGIDTFLITDISKDGTLEGPNIELYEKINSLYDLQLIASGGVGSKSDLEALKQINIENVIVGKALYEKKVALKELVE